MRELFRDTLPGHFIRLISGGKLLPFEEDRDPDVWRRYVDGKKSGHLAHHGTVEPEEKTEENSNGSCDTVGQTQDGDLTNHPAQPESRRSSGTMVDNRDHRINEHSGVKVDPESGKDVALISWYSENDPENPQNWSSPKKFFVTFLICFLTFAIYIGSAIYSAGEMGVEERFGVSQVKATLGLTLFVAGYGIGPMLFAPMSEIPHFGRNPIYIGTLFVFVFFQFAVIYATNFAMLLCFRFLTGFFGSPVLATGGASLSDMYAPSKRAYAIAIWGLAAVCGPVMGPLVGGFAAQHKGWQWPIWELLWLSGAALITMVLFLPETSAANILYRRARRLRKITGRTDLKSEGELEGEGMSPKDIAYMTLLKPFQLMLTEPILLALNLYIALIYGLLYIWFESFAIVFIEIYHFNLGEEGLAFLGILIGGFVVVPPFFWFLHKYLEPKFNENGELKPEERLPPAFVGAFCIPICLFWFGWTSRPEIHWIVPIIGSSFFTIGTFLLFNSVLNYLPDAYPTQAASVLAGNDFMRSAFGAGFPLFASAMFKNLGVAWASSTLAFLSIAFIPIPFVLYFYGERIRKNSKRARHDL